MVSTRKKILAFAITLAGLLVLFLLAVNTGSLKVTPGELIRGLFVEYNENVAAIYDLRFPRIFIAMFGGGAVAVSGVLLQAVMKNPLADPGHYRHQLRGKLCRGDHNCVFSYAVFCYAAVCLPWGYGCLCAGIHSFLERGFKPSADHFGGGSGKRCVYRPDERF